VLLFIYRQIFLYKKRKSKENQKFLVFGISLIWQISWRLDPIRRKILTRSLAFFKKIIILYK